MSIAAFLAYCTAVTIAAAMPGPSMFAVVTTGVSRGFTPAFAVGVGVAAADVVLVVLALAGLVVIVQTFEWVFAALKYAGAAYLIWLGIRMWRTTAGGASADALTRRVKSRSFLLGASIGLGNPKAILFHAAIMPLILDLKALTLADCLVIVVAIVAANVAVMTIYASLSGIAARWFRTERGMWMVNRIGGAAMIGTGALIAAR